MNKISFITLLLVLSYLKGFTQKSNILNQLSKKIRFKGLASIELTKESYSKLDSIAFLINSDSLNYSIESYSSTYGTQKNNLIKTKKRALLLKNILVQKGVNPIRISILYFGEQNNISTTTRCGYYLNERIKIKKVADGIK